MNYGFRKKEKREFITITYGVFSLQWFSELI